MPELNRLHAVARDLAFQAKMEEAKAFPNKDLSYEAYENAVLAYTDVDDYISKHSMVCLMLLNMQETKPRQIISLHL